MTEIIDGEVVVIRDGDFVEAVFYRQFYCSIFEFAEEVKQYLSVKSFEQPNLSYMIMQEGRLKAIEKKTDFFDEFEEFIKLFNNKSSAKCDCGSLNFVYLNSPQTFCPNCKK